MALDRFSRKGSFMPRIPDDELARLKQDIAIERLAAARGIVLKPACGIGDVAALMAFSDW